MTPLLALILAAALQAPSGPAADACSVLVSERLEEAVREKFPGYRIARATDYSLEELHERGEQKATPCPAVAIADADGNGLQDFALFLTAEGKHLLLAVALQVRESSWQVSQLEDFGPGTASRNFVEPLKPANYTDNAPGFTPGAGRVRSFKATSSGFRAGRVEASSMAFFFNGKRWVHLYLSE